MTTQAQEGLHEPRWTFGDRIRKIRKDAGLNQVEFAAKINKGDKAVASWETGTSEPRDIVAVALRIQAAFGVTAGWTLGLASDTGKPDPGVEARQYQRLLAVVA